MTFNFSMQGIDQVINSAAKTLYMSAGDVSLNLRDTEHFHEPYMVLALCQHVIFKTLDCILITR